MSGPSSERFFASVSEFVEYSGGNHAIQKILIANNGIGATKAIKSIRRWSFETFGNERKIKFVVMATPEDLNANAEYIRMADEVVDVPGGTNNNNYANINLICEIAVRLHVDAVMPLWGHASENPLLPSSLLNLPHKVTFIGPSAEPMYALGDKIGSTIIAQSAGVPTIAWNGDDLRVNYREDGIPQEVYDQANVTNAEDALKCAVRIGFPVMIKASEGGGGKGIRKVTCAEDVKSLFRQVQSEIPGSPIFVMKMATKARHLEVQLLADQHGEAIALSGRDCSVQRRHQKIIEEGPPIAAPVNVFKEMEKAAVALAKTVGYANAGTVEYLYLEETQKFAFLELNPRLQVEHPVTENILGINLPACQLQVAMGLPLCRIMDIRRLYGRHPWGKDTIDFEYSERKVAPRHCIGVRVTAENPNAGFQPTSGRIEELHFRSSVDVWGYFSVDHTSRVHEFADSQFGHIFSSGVDRESARRAMVVALKELTIRGDIHTTIEYIIKMIQSDDYVNNHIDTAWLDGRIDRHQYLFIEESAKFCPPPTSVVLSGAALQGFRHFDNCGKEFINMLRVGQVPSKETLSRVVDIDLIFNNVKYSIVCTQSSAAGVIVECNGSRQNVTLRSLSDGGYLIDVRGHSHLAYVKQENSGAVRMILDGHTCIFTPEYDPTQLISSVAGKFARQLVSDGSHLNVGDAYVEIEVMKMYMPLKALESGTINFQLSEGATLSPGDVIATMDLDFPDKVVRAELFKGTLHDDVDGQCSAGLSTPSNAMREALRQIFSVLDGFYCTDEEIQQSMDELLQGFDNPLICAHELEEAMSVLRGRIDAELTNEILNTCSNYKTALKKAQKAGTGVLPDFPAGPLLALLHSHAQAMPADKRSAFVNQTVNVWSSVEKYLFTPEVRKLSTLLSLVEKYLAVETLFDSMSFTDVVGGLRKENIGDLEKVLNLCRSHINVDAKNSLVIRALEEMKSLSISSTIPRPRMPVGVPLRNEINIRNLKLRLKDLAKLRRSACTHVSFTANLVLMSQNALRPESRRQRLHDAITSALITGDPVGEGDRLVCLKKFVESNGVIRDLLLEALRQDRDYQLAAMELYLLKIYHTTHNMANMKSGWNLSDDCTDVSPWIKFEFNTKKVGALETVESPSSSQRKRPTYAELTNLARSKSAPHMDSFDAEDVTHRAPSPNQRSTSESSNPLIRPVVQGLRQGVLAVVEDFSELPRLFPLIVQRISIGKSHGLVNALHIVVMRAEPLTSGLSNYDDEDISNWLSEFLRNYFDLMNARGVRRVSFLVGHPLPKHGHVGAAPKTVSLFTFRQRFQYGEDKLFRQVEAPHAFHLDLPRLANFTVSLESIPTSSGNAKLYKAIPLSAAGGKRPQHRYFVRLISFTNDVHNSDAESLFVEALDHLGIVIGQEQAAMHTPRGAVVAAANHIFLNIVAPDVVVQLDYYESDLRRICIKYWNKMVRLGITTVELKLSCRISADSDALFVRLVATNPTGHVLKIDKYYEANVDGRAVFKSLVSEHDEATTPGPWHGLDTQTPYEVSQPFERQRAEAMAASDTLYVYDWPTLFEHGIESMWEPLRSSTTLVSNPGTPRADRKLIRRPSANNAPAIGTVFTSRELVLCDPWTEKPLPANWTASHAETNSVMLPVQRPAGCNDVGMVAWLFRMITPECPQGRELVVICNDITFQAGSFGTREDMVFFKASEYARIHGIPRFFLAANSGARIGMAQTLKSKFQVCWTDDKDPSKGFKYLYVTKEDYEKMVAKASEIAAKTPDSPAAAIPVNCNPVKGPDGELRYLITDIIGEEPDLGVENLMGSGLIAGETSRAYEEIFTLTLVVGRTVGIGAYLVRLGQRTIQKARDCPIILTGYQALNKLMGREIYSTNDQLGGPMIMFHNGVSHLLSENHMDSVNKALTWLSFVPPVKGQSAPHRELSSSVDTLDRLVHFVPQKGLTYDPRMLLSGCDGDVWQSGFFDKGSFVEALGGWAKTVVVGRGRLGGIPMGVIVTENRTSEAIKPADPADSTSQEKLVQQAGGVWFPDSAYKTAQALRDFSREGLPCMIFANWRGFSGGQRDMFDEVLKFGSMIVDALVAYQHPIFVYIPPFAELRGGAWVVVDSTINADVMEFYAAEDARGGVLEAAGAASIKYRDRDIIATAHRIDPTLVQLDAKLAAIKANSAEETSSVHSSPTKPTEEILELEKQIKQRERMLFGVFQQVAVHFADLHDTPGRMKAKGVIRKQVQWAYSRIYFYWRLRRRSLEFQLAADLVKLNAGAPVSPHHRRDFCKDLHAWYLAHAGTKADLDDDRAVVNWMSDNHAAVQEFVNSKKSHILSSRLAESLASIASFSEAVEGAESSGNNTSVLNTAIAKLPEADRAALLKALQEAN